MPSDKVRVFEKIDQDDAALAAEIAEHSGIALPKECETGVAFNARLLQAHVLTMRNEEPR